MSKAYTHVSFSALSWFASASKTSTWMCWSSIGKKGVEGQSTRVTALWSSWDMQKRFETKSLKSLNCGLTLKGLLDTPSASIGLSAEVGLGFRRSFGQRWLCGGDGHADKSWQRRNSHSFTKESKLYKVKNQVAHIDLAGGPNGLFFGQK